MKCPHCDEDGGEENSPLRCSVCGGTGHLCDICGEAVDDPGDEICEQCREAEAS